MAAEPHVMLLPWSAFGHLLPFFELSKSLAIKGFKVSFISTARNIQRLPPMPTDLPKKMSLVQIPLPPESNLPEFAEATIDVPLDKVQYLKKAYDGLRDAFERLVTDSPPDWIVHDFVPHWALEVAEKHQVPTVFFSVYSAAALSYLGPPDRLPCRTSPEDFTLTPDWFTFPTSIRYSKHEAPPMLKSLNGCDASGTSSAHRLVSVIKHCKFVAIRTCKDFEGKYVDLLGQLYQKPVVPVGFLVEGARHNRRNHWEDAQMEKVFDWLDGQRPGSVLFVGFGSEYRIGRQEVHELAYGLELSGLPFVWVLRKPVYAETDVEGVALPEGFEERSKSQGSICKGWVPQAEILAHPAIGGCLFHSGWGTIIEALRFGHALVLLPMMADQGLNARLLVEKGIGVEVERKEDGSFSRDGIAQSVRHVMVEKDGEVYRVRAREMGSIFSNQKLHEDCMNNLARNLYNNKTQKGEKDVR